MDPFLSDNDEIWGHLEGLSDEYNKTGLDSDKSINSEKEFVCNNCGKINKYILTDGDY